MNKLINELNNSIRNIKDELEEKGLNIPTIESEIEKIKFVRDKLIIFRDELEKIIKTIKEKR